MQSIGAQIRQARIERGFTQQDLAQKLHVTRSTVSNWEQGTRSPDANMLLELIQVLDIDFLVNNEKGAERPVGSPSEKNTSHKMEYKAPNVMTLDQKELDGLAAPVRCGSVFCQRQYDI